MLTLESMKKGGRYNWKCQPERLVYLGHNWSGNGYWHQFVKVEEPDVVWCEVLTKDLHMLEETQPALVLPIINYTDDPIRRSVKPKPQRIERKPLTAVDHARIQAAAERRAKRNARRAK